MNNFKIFLVNNNPIECDNIVETFNMIGVYIKSTTDEQDVLRLFFDDYPLPDLIIVDSFFKIMTPSYILKLLKKSKRTKHIPVFVLVEPWMSADKFLQSGATNILKKPFRLSEFTFATAVCDIKWHPSRKKIFQKVNV